MNREQIHQHDKIDGGTSGEFDSNLIQGPLVWSGIWGRARPSRSVECLQMGKREGSAATSILAGWFHRPRLTLTRTWRRP